MDSVTTKISEALASPSDAVMAQDIQTALTEGAARLMLFSNSLTINAWPLTTLGAVIVMCKSGTVDALYNDVTQC